jgi:hypothetical protein
MADTPQFGDKLKPLIPFIIGFILFQIFFWTILKPNSMALESISIECKTDSLNLVIDSLQTEIFYLEDGFDDKEHRYEQALYDCEHKRRLRIQKHKGQLKQQFRYE